MNKIIYDLPKMKYSEQKGLVSIVVPIYNNETYLNKCIDSILSQTFSNWEAILVNDGSTDGTGKIIDEYAKKDSRFIAIHKQNQGTLLARKTGLENSKGEFIASIDSDDAFSSKFLEKMYAKITEANADFVWCKIYKSADYNWNIEASKNVIAVMDKQQGVTCYTWNKLIKRDIYAKVQFPNINLTSGEDPVQTLQVAYHSKSATFVPENLYFYCKGSKVPFIRYVQSAVILNETLEVFFNGVVPQDVKNAFYCSFSYQGAYCFFSLSKKERLNFENELKPFLPYFIKHGKIRHLKILCILANKGIEFPLKFYNMIKKIVLAKG